MLSRSLNISKSKKKFSKQSMKRKKFILKKLMAKLNTLLSRLPTKISSLKQKVINSMARLYLLRWQRLKPINITLSSMSLIVLERVTKMESLQ
jgi:hypothetical protein